MQTRIGRYELVEPLGRGGMGTVWSAVLVGPQGFRKPVALKVLRDPGAAAESLVHEARLGAMLSHPNVVSILELGEADGQWYVAMELVRGVSLGELAARAPLPGSVVLEIGAQLCRGLHHVHTLAGDVSAVVVHRDVKPPNVLIDRSGTVKLADLGIARLLGVDGAVAGTPSFMAPEQRRGVEDVRADLFSVGATLYAITARRLPFGRGADAAAAIEGVEALLDDPSFLRPVDEAVPGLGAVVARCLRFRPSDRWADAEVLGNALRALRTAVPPGPSLDELVSPAREVASPSRVDTVPGRVIAPPTAFVGREVELAAALRALERGPVAVVGAPGIGKTRFATEIAVRLQEGVAGGAWLVDLGAASGVVAACGAVARVLRGQLGGDPVGDVARLLASRGAVVLVLDEADRVGPELGAAVEAWRTASPALEIVVTARRAPDGPFTTLALPPLPLAEALALFRARSPRARDDRAARALVDRLEGLPLAIELAAARSRSTPLSLLVRRLDDRLRVLATDEPGVPARQRSLTAALDSAVEPLPADARSTLAQLAVFVGTFELEAALAVVDLAALPGRPSPVVALDTLVDHHLVHVEGARFRIWAHVRDYAWRLFSDVERQAAVARHGAWYAAMGTADAVDATWRAGTAEVRQRRVAETENLIAASRRAVERGAAAVAVDAALALWSVAEQSVPYPAHLELLEEAAEVARGTPSERRVLRALAVAALRTGDVASALAVVDRGVEVATAAGDVLEVVRCRGTRAGHLFYSGRMAEARATLEELVAPARASGDLQVASWILVQTAILRRATGDTDGVRALYLEGLALARAGGFVAEVMQAEASLATLDVAEGRIREAMAGFERAAAFAVEGGRVIVEHHCRCALAALRSSWGRDPDAVPTFQRALRYHRVRGDQPSVARTALSLAEVLRLEGRTDDALAVFAEARAACARSDDHRSEGRVCVQLAHSWLDDGDVDRAAAALAEAAGLLPADRPVQDELAHADARFLAATHRADEAWERIVGVAERLRGAALADAAVLAVLAGDRAGQDAVGKRLAAADDDPPAVGVPRAAALARLLDARGLTDERDRYRAVARAALASMNLYPTSWLAQRARWWGL